jgi:hypothetical protein
MATRTLGTAANNTLTAVLYQRAPNASGTETLADYATIAAGIKDDQNPAAPVVYGSFDRNGVLFIPRRGFLQPLPGDYIAFDSTTGWPILVSGKAAAAAGWVHS